MGKVSKSDSELLEKSRNGKQVKGRQTAFFWLLAKSFLLRFTKNLKYG